VGEAERSLKFATTLWQNAFGSGGETEITANRMGRFGMNTPKKPEATPPGEEPCWIEGKEIKDFPWETTLPSGEARWLIDNKRTGYFIPPKSPILHIARRTQSWTYANNKLFERKYAKYPQGDERNYNPTEGNFSVAWFDHGAKPDVAECIYTLIPATTPEAMKKFAADMASPDTAPYIVREKDTKAHILWDRETNTTGYIIFDPKWEAPKKSRLLKANRICSVMIKEVKDGKIKLSATSTDMDEWPAWGGGKIKLSGNIVLTLDGKWIIADIAKDAPADCSATHADGKTTLVIPYKTFLPVNLTLKPAN
jgi:chondroitin-sulfate-ABC endolyase/exolyase